MRLVLYILAILATIISASLAVLVAVFAGASPLYAYGIIFEFEWTNLPGLILLLLLYAPFPLWLAFLFSKGPK